MDVNDGADKKVSAPGRYEGYSAPVYDGYERSSVYVPMRDGVRLAVDIFRPVKDGVPAGPLPAILKVFRYGRAWVSADGELTHVMSSDMITPPTSVPRDVPPRLNVLRKAARYGYVIAMMDVRGGGASFGQATGHQSREGAQDMADVIAWIADHPWCDGKVGMYGRSFAGSSQIVATTMKPPALKAIFPGVHTFDEHTTVLSGGVYRACVLEMYNKLVDRVDGLGEVEPRVAAPVDDDPDCALRDEALELRKADPGILHYVKAFKDNVQNYRFPSAYSTPPASGSVNPATLLPEMQASEIPLYEFAGWMDFAVDAGILTYANWTAPRKMMIGPWTHSPDEPDDPREDASVEIEAVEVLRWFDYWLKGIDNGVMDEPPITYAVMDGGQGWDWRDADVWPPRDSAPETWYFRGEKSGSIASLNDGGLSREKPADAAGDDAGAPDYSVTTGLYGTRWAESFGVTPFDCPDQTDKDQKCWTYTSAPFDKEHVLLGAPVLELYLRSSAPDTDIVVWVERVTPDGFSQYLTEGQLRASHRTLRPAPYDTLGLPWTSSYPEDVDAAAPLSDDDPALLKFALLPLCARFAPGDRLRIAIACCDTDNFTTLKTDPAPRLRIERNQAYPSAIHFQTFR